MMAQSTEIKKTKQAFENPQWYLSRADFNIRIRSETVGEFLNGTGFENILDIGCGDGSLSLPLLNGQNHLTLLDQSQPMLSVAGSRVPGELALRVQLINKDFMEATLASQSFDLVLAVGVLAFIERRREFIVRIKSLLKPGGSVIVECSDGAHFISRSLLVYDAVRKRMRGRTMQTVVEPSSDLLALFRDLGFELCGSYRYTLPLPVVRKFSSSGFKYKWIRWLFGSARQNRNRWLGNECLYHFQLSAKEGAAL